MQMISANIDQLIAMLANRANEVQALGVECRLGGLESTEGCT